jgi:hypothetical protein
MLYSSWFSGVKRKMNNIRKNFVVLYTAESPEYLVVPTRNRIKRALYLTEIRISTDSSLNREAGGAKNQNHLLPLYQLELYSFSVTFSERRTGAELIELYFSSIVSYIADDLRFS